MSRLIPHGDMSGQEIYRCCSEAIALINLCHLAAWSLQGETDIAAVSQIAGDVHEATRLAAELLEPVSDALEGHEGLKGSDA